MVDEGMIFSMADQKWQDMQGHKYRPKPSWAAETRGRGGHTHTHGGRERKKLENLMLRELPASSELF